MKLIAKYPFNGNAAEAQLTFPAGAVIEQTTNDPQHAPRNGWIHGTFQNQRGWFPVSHVEQIAQSTSNLMMAASMPTAPEATYVMPEPMSASAPPVVAAIPVPESAVAPMMPPAAAQPPSLGSIPPMNSFSSLPPQYSTPKPLNEDQISQLMQQGYTRGLALSLNDAIKTFAKRIWIVDNSGSMQKTDGHRPVETGEKQQVKFVQCSRWEEITGCVCYHIQLAALLGAPTSFRLLNDPGAAVGPQQFTVDTTNTIGAADIKSPPEALNIIQKARPGGCTPLTNHILAIHAEIETMLPQLRANGQKIAIVIATDGLPTDDRGYGGAAHQEQFVSALRMLEGFPVWVVIRLCTDEEDVVNFYNNLDQLLELSMEVLDDFCGEAEEVHEHNSWLTYALPLHRVREMGFHDRVFDLLDERQLTKSEMRDFCSLLMGPSYIDGMPDPSVDWEGFMRLLDRWLKEKKEVSQQWDPMKKKMRPWMDLHKLNHSYGDGSCVIL